MIRQPDREGDGGRIAAQETLRELDECVVGDRAGDPHHGPARAREVAAPERQTHREQSERQGGRAERESAVGLAFVPTPPLAVALLARDLEELVEGQRRRELDGHVLLGLARRKRGLEPLEAEQRRAIFGVEEDEAILEHDPFGDRGRGDRRRARLRFGRTGRRGPVDLEDRSLLREDRLVEARHVDEHALEVLARLVDLAGLDAPAVQVRGHAGAKAGLAGQLEHAIAGPALGVR